MTESTTRSSLVSGPEHQPGTSLPPYGRDIPHALQDLSQLLPDAPVTEDDQQPEEPSTSPTEDPSSKVEIPETQDPAQVPVDHHQQEEPASDPPVVIGYTRASHQVHQPAQFVYAGYHCKNLAQTGIRSIFDFHPFTSLRAFASTIAQPDVYPNAMPLNVADWD